MSGVINYVSKYITIIATDTRISYGRNAEYGFSDDNVKLVELPNMGWCSGVGYHDFLELFKSNLAKSTVHTPGEIEDIFNNSIEIAMDKCIPTFEEDIKASAVSFSWLSATPEDLFCRIGIMSKKHFNNNIMFMNFDEFQVLFPGEYLDNLGLAKQFEDAYDLKYQVSFDDPETLNKLLNRALSMFNYISKQAKSVSRTCHVGILLLSQQGLYKFRSIVDIDLLEE